MTGIVLGSRAAGRLAKQSAFWEAHAAPSVGGLCDNCATPNVDRQMLVPMGPAERVDVRDVVESPLFEATRFPGDLWALGKTQYGDAV